jgi:hypothetical protein
MRSSNNVFVIEVQYHKEAEEGGGEEAHSGVRVTARGVLRNAL